MPSSTPFTVSAGLGPAHARSGGLEIHYEPVADLASGAVTGAEALLRRRMPGGVVQIAARFLPEAEANGLLVGIGRRVVDRACEQAAGWQSSRRGATVTVNLSALELADPGVVDWVEAVITRHALPAELLILDVPEVLVARAALDGGAHLQHLRELAGLGVRIAVDDVGTGAAAPTYLPLVPASVLKIDGRTVRALDRSPESPLVAALAALGHELGLRVLAEGVEHEELLPRLHELGCDLAQGYAIGRATSPNRIAALLRG